jgi:hypothetical protein
MSRASTQHAVSALVIALSFRVARGIALTVSRCRSHDTSSPLQAAKEAKIREAKEAAKKREKQREANLFFVFGFRRSLPFRILATSMKTRTGRVVDAASVTARPIPSPTPSQRGGGTTLSRGKEVEVEVDFGPAIDLRLEAAGEANQPLDRASLL